MKKLLVLALTFLITSSAIAQYVEIIYLKNGSKVKGKIVEFKPNERIKFLTSDGNLWIFQLSEVEKFDLKKIDEYEYERDTLKRRYLQCDLGFLVGTVANDMKAPLSFLATYNFQVYNSLYFGLGTGLEFFQMTYIPLVADFRIAPKNRNVSFFIQGGFTFPMNGKGDIDEVEYKFKRGFLINPGIAYTFAAKNSTAFTISIGYRYQETDAERAQNTDYPYYYSNDYSLITKLNRFVIRVGYTFL
jgi:hypothetical protein